VQHYVAWHGLLNFIAIGSNMMIAKSATPDRDRRIADLAHQIWEQEGRPEGQSEAHWLRAAALVDETAPKAPAKKKATAAKAPKKK
jgi:Protein of unknown function (DUF2934)